MLTQYDTYKKTTFDVIFPKDFKDIINVKQLLTISKDYYKHLLEGKDFESYYTINKDKIDDLFYKCSTDDIYNLFGYMFLINESFTNASMYLTIVDDNHIVKFLNDYIDNVVFIYDDFENIRKDTVDNILNILKDIYQREAYKTDDMINMLYIEDQGVNKFMYIDTILLYILRNDIINYAKLESYLIEILGNKELSKNPSNPFIYMLPHYVNYTNVINKLLND